VVARRTQGTPHRHKGDTGAQGAPGADNGAALVGRINGLPGDEVLRFGCPSGVGTSDVDLADREMISKNRSPPAPTESVSPTEKFVAFVATAGNVAGALRRPRRALRPTPRP